MKTTYTVTTRMPKPTVGVVASATMAFFHSEEANEKIVRVSIDTSKCEAWLQDVKALAAHPDALFGAMVDGKVTVSLTDKNTAEAFEAKWGEA